MAQDFDFPPIVYKYRTWTDINHQRMLRNNELYLSSPADFNDPFDCRIPVNYLLLDTRKKIEEYIDGFIGREYDQLLLNGVDPTRLMKIMFDRLTNQRQEMQSE